MVTLNNPAYSGSDEQVLEQIREKYLYKHLTLPVQMKASFLTGTVAKLTLRCDQTEVTVTGETVQEAANSRLLWKIFPNNWENWEEVISI